jgi:hypothetical protein
LKKKEDLYTELASRTAWLEGEDLELGCGRLHVLVEESLEEILVRGMYTCKERLANPEPCQVS